eukprot:scaffold148690_cov42-Cyclotella_meneghiniana.AAC.3
MIEEATTSTTPQANRTAVSGYAADVGGSAAYRGKGGKKKKVSDQTSEEVAKRMMNGPFASLSRHLASLPQQVSTSIEKKCTSMLALVNEIDTKTTALAPFGKMVTIAKTGERVLYAPVCSREAKNPLSGSNSIKDTDEYKTIDSDYDELLRDFVVKSTNLIHKSAKLEVTERKRILREEIVRAAIEVAPSSTSTNCLLNPPSNHSFFESSAELGNLDKRVQYTIVSGLKKLFPLMTWEAWNSIRDAQAFLAINTHLAVKTVNKTQSKINKEMEGTITEKVALDKET